MNEKKERLDRWKGELNYEWRKERLDRWKGELKNKWNERKVWMERKGKWIGEREN